MDTQTFEQLVAVTAKAVEQTYRDLCSNFPETYYYVALITSGEACPPEFSACSYESLERQIATSTYAEPFKFLKWSCVESPYYCYKSEYFNELEKLYDKRPQIYSLTAEQWQAEYDLRLLSMEKALQELDALGLFGLGLKRKQLVINVEVLPPDSSNTARAERLNPPEAFAIWLSEYAS